MSDTKIETMCAECRDYKSSAVAEVTDDESLKFICPRGHTFHAVLRTPLYVPIFENALRAYDDEEYYECYLSAVTSLEKFRNTAIKAYFWSTNNHKPMDKIIDKSHAIKYSERSIASFATISLLLFGESAIPMLNKMYDSTEKRNRVIHGTLIPTKCLCEEVIKNVYQVVKFFQISWIDDDGYCPISNYQDAIATDNYEAIISNKKEHELAVLVGKLYTLSAIQVVHKDKELDVEFNRSFKIIMDIHHRVFW